MLEREALNFIIDITVCKEQYFCRIESKETREIWEFSKSVSLTGFAQTVGRNLFMWTFLQRGWFGMEEKFVRERIRTCIREKCEQACFYLADETFEPASVGIFITWEGESNEA